MSEGTPTVAVPMRFAGVDILVQAMPATVVGSQPTSAADRLSDLYGRVESVVTRVASSVAGTVARLAEEAASPEQIEVEFGLAVSVEGDVMLVRGSSEATLSVTLTYGTSA